MGLLEERASPLLDAEAGGLVSAGTPAGFPCSHISLARDTISDTTVTASNNIPSKGYACRADIGIPP
jgi:hypothetical protein